MAGIASLTDIYKKRGRDFIDTLFDNYVTINEKLDGSAFAIERNPITKDIEFFKRDNSAPITVIDRTLVKYYEAPILHFTSLMESNQDIMSKLPSGWRFGFEYFVNNNPQEIAYDRVPKNNLVLSYIHVKNAAGKIIRTVQEKEELDKWADILQVERPPIIFQGMLNNDQKEKILEFIDTPYDNLVKKFKTESFVRYIINILNPKMGKTFLNEDLEKPIEGIVFRFGINDQDVVVSKIVDPMFTEMAKAKPVRIDGEGNDLYYLTLIDVCNYINDLNFNKVKPKGKTYEQRYLNFVCAIFNGFVDEFGDQYKDMDFNEPAYLKKPEFDLNSDFIMDPVTLSNIDRAQGFKRLFKIILASFRKKKRKPNGVFTKEVIDQFNLTVERVNRHLTQNLRENEIPLFGEFLSNRGRELSMDEPEDIEEAEEVEKDEDKTEDGEFEEFKAKIGDLLVQDEEDETPKKKKKTGKKVNIIVGRFQPFHNGHLKMAEDLHAINKLPVVIVVVHPDHNNSGNSPFSVSTIKSMLDNIKVDTKGLICDYRVIKRGFIKDIIDCVRPEYEPIVWGVGPDRENDYKKQLELNFTRKNELDLSDKFELMLCDRHMSATDVRAAIQEDNFGKFKDMVPKCVKSMYPLLRNDIIRNEKVVNEAAEYIEGTGDQKKSDEFMVCWDNGVVIKNPSMEELQNFMAKSGKIEIVRFIVNTDKKIIRVPVIDDRSDFRIVHKIRQAVKDMIKFDLVDDGYEIHIGYGSSTSKNIGGKTVKDLLAYNADFGDIIPICFHGTTTEHLEDIEKMGIKPRAKTFTDQNWDRFYTDKSEDLIYLTIDYDVAKQYADTAAEKMGGDPVIIEIHNLPANYAVMDDDFETNVGYSRLISYLNGNDPNDPTKIDYIKSIRANSQFAYTQNIPKSMIYKIHKDVE